MYIYEGGQKALCHLRTLLPHFTSYSFACSKIRFAKHVKKSTFVNRACDSTAHRAYRTRKRYNQNTTLFFVFQEALAQIDFYGHA